MTKAKICTCDPVMGNIKASEALDLIRPDGKIVARYNKSCEIHGYKRDTLEGEHDGISVAETGD